MSTETATIASYTATADDVAWLQAVHALELCRQAVEMAARYGLTRQSIELTRHPAKPVHAR